MIWPAMWPLMLLLVRGALSPLAPLAALRDDRLRDSEQVRKGGCERSELALVVFSCRTDERLAVDEFLCEHDVDGGEARVDCSAIPDRDEALTEPRILALGL